MWRRPEAKHRPVWRAVAHGSAYEGAGGICTVQDHASVGTSAVVQPAASLPSLAKQNGARIMEINVEKAFPEADYLIMEKAGTALPRIVEEMKKTSIL